MVISRDDVKNSLRINSQFRPVHCSSSNTRKIHSNTNFIRYKSTKMHGHTDIRLPHNVFNSYRNDVPLGAAVCLCGLAFPTSFQ